MLKLKKARGEGAAAWRTLWQLRRFMILNWRAVVLGVFLLAGMAALDLLKPWPLKFIIDDIVGQELEGTTLYLLIGVVTAVVLIAAFSGLMSFLVVFFVNRAGRTIVFEVRAALFDHVQRLSLQYHSRKSTGDLLTRLTGDVKAVRDVLTESIAALVNSVLFFFGDGRSALLARLAACPRRHLRLAHSRLRPGAVQRPHPRVLAGRAQARRSACFRCARDPREHPA